VAAHWAGYEASLEAPSLRDIHGQEVYAEEHTSGDCRPEVRLLCNELPSLKHYQEEIFRRDNLLLEYVDQI
jgi:hypothetical protein